MCEIYFIGLPVLSLVNTLHQTKLNQVNASRTKYTFPWIKEEKASVLLPLTTNCNTTAAVHEKLLRVAEYTAVRMSIFINVIVKFMTSIFC